MTFPLDRDADVPAMEVNSWLWFIAASMDRRHFLQALLSGLALPWPSLALPGKGQAVPPFPKFLERFPPSGAVKPVPAVECRKYEGKLPASLLALWEHVGRGPFGGGLVVLVDPAAWHSTLEKWLVGGADDRWVIARSAFGDLFYYRDRGTHVVGGQAEKIEDVSRLDPHLGKLDVCSWSLKGFFEQYLTSPQDAAQALRPTLFEAAVKRLGLPAGDEGFYFVPALKAGGSAKEASVQKGDLRVHLDLLRQLQD